MQTPEFILTKLRKRTEEGTLRVLSLAKNLTDFSSNDYLGFARSKALTEEINKLEAGKPYGSTGSRLLTGNNPLAEELEKELAAFHEAEAALLFNSGYDANLGLFSSIAGKDDTILYDELIHASIKDGARLSLAKHFSFRHNNVEHLEKKLSAAIGNIFVAVESVYSMDGDSAPLQEIAALLYKYPNTYLIVDEAHATGVFGPKGQGLVQELKLADKCFARVHTFGKALGTHGAAVLCRKGVKDYLVNFARPLIYTTALPPSSLTATQVAYRYMQNGSEMEMLRVNIQLFNQYAQARKLNTAIHNSAIRTIIVPGSDKARQMAQRLHEAGFDVRPILSPTVPQGKERLRICLHSFNTEKEIRGLIDIIVNWI